MLSRDRTSLLGILDSIGKIERYISPFGSAVDLFRDTTLFDAVLMNFIVIGEMVSRLSIPFKESNREVDWEKIKGMRNVIAHDYFGVDAEEIWQIAKNSLPKLKENIQIILEKDRERG
jgi:uncharacterized protein with HEPN domain